jgi:membrane protease YdiL (CAAX protease family)
LNDAVSESIDAPIPLPPPPPPIAPAHARLVALGEVLLCSGVPTQLLIGFLLTAAGWSPEVSSLSYVLTLTLADTLVLLVLMVSLMRAHGESASTLWVGRRPLAREALVGLLLIPFLLVMVTVLINALHLLVPSLHNVQTNPLEALASGTSTEAAIFGLVAIIGGGVREELQRAFILHRFEEHLGGAAVGAVVSSVAFGYFHLLQGKDAAIAAGALGFVWAVVFLRRRSTVAPIVSHAGFDALQILGVALGLGR